MKYIVIFISNRPKTVVEKHTAGIRFREKGSGQGFLKFPLYSCSKGTALA